MNFGHFGVRNKLLISYAALIGMMAIVGAVGWRNTQELSQEVENMYENQVKGAVLLANSESALWKLRYGFPQFLVQPEKRRDIRTEEPQLYDEINKNLQ